MQVKTNVGGEGIFAGEQASGSLEGVVIKENEFWFGIFLENIDEVVSVKDVWVADNTQKLDLGATMLQAHDVQNLDVSRALFLRNAGVGVLSRGAKMQVSDVLVAETYSTSEEGSLYGFHGSGTGLALFGAGDITMERIASAGNQSSGFYMENTLSNSAGIVKASDLRITDTKSRDDMTQDGEGLVIYSMHVDINRLEVLRNTRIGFFCHVAKDCVDDARCKGE